MTFEVRWQGVLRIAELLAREMHMAVLIPRRDDAALTFELTHAWRRRDCVARTNRSDLAGAQQQDAVGNGIRIWRGIDPGAAQAPGRRAFRREACRDADTDQQQNEDQDCASRQVHLAYLRVRGTIGRSMWATRKTSCAMCMS